MSQLSFVYVVVALFIVYLAYRRARFNRVRDELPALLARGAVIVDVRTQAEFVQDHNPNSRNLPLSSLVAECGELPRDKPVVVCCASGARSAAAVRMLRAQGFDEVHNAGPWSNTVLS
jgi:phage shock protein E